MSELTRRQLLASGVAVGGSVICSPTWPQGTLQRAPQVAFVKSGDEEQYYDWDASPNHGYDPTEVEPERSPLKARSLDTTRGIPPSAVVDPKFLPPVGTQGHAESCVSWAAGYGLATFMLAKKAGRDPSLAVNQVSPAYLYSSVRNALARGCRYDSGSQDLACKPERKSPNEELGGGPTNIAMTLQILQRFGSTNCEETPYPRVAIGSQPVAAGALYSNIYQRWSSTSGAPSLKLKGFESYRFGKADQDPLGGIRAVLAGGDALVYGTREPVSWKPDAEGGPWEKYQDIKMNGSTPAGHALLIIGYDDEMESSTGKGAILLQNSWGSQWGMSWVRAFGKHYSGQTHKTRGYVWITYEAFLKLAQGTAFAVEV